MMTTTLTLNEATNSRTGKPTRGRTHCDPGDILELPVMNFAQPVENVAGRPIEAPDWAKDDSPPMVQNIEQPQVDPTDILDIPTIAW